MMRSLLLTGVLLLLSVAGAGKTSASGPVHVSGYTTKSGTVVAPYYRRAPGTAGSTYTPTVRVYSSCADARASGRWNILRTDLDYSPTLDRDSDGIACEAGSDGTSNGRDPDPIRTGGGVMAPGSASNPVSRALTYPEQLAGIFGWKPGATPCNAISQKLQADYDESTDPTIPEYLVTDSYTDPALNNIAVIDNVTNARISLASVSHTWAWRQKQNPAVAAIQVEPTAEPGISYLTQVMPGPAGTTAICITAYALRH